MHGSLKRLLEHAVDFAGTFPPGSLPLDQAIARYDALSQGPESWILGRLVLGANDLVAAAPLLAPLGEIEVSVVGRASDAATWGDARAEDALSMNALLDACPDADIAGYEVRVPEGDGFRERLEDLLQFQELDAFVEVGWTSDLPERLTAIAEIGLFAKVRTGGDAVPSASQLASFLFEANALDLPFKLTAGLHHRYPAVVRGEVQRHGYGTVFGAFALLAAQEWAPSEIANVLADDNPNAWNFGDGGFSYHGEWIDLDAIEDARSLLLSFGSCSVETPLKEATA